MQAIVVEEKITRFIRTEVGKRKSHGIVIGLSGGLDSSVTAVLAVKALGSDMVFGLIMPERDITPDEDLQDAKRLVDNIGIKYAIIDISESKSDLVRSLPRDKLAEGNLSSRLRMCLLYYYASVMHRLVIGTSDKSEIALGYYSKFGDGAYDFAPIADLYKTEVRELARHLKIDPSIIEKKSSPRLWKNQTAEDEIGVSYEVIDRILKSYYSSEMDLPDIDRRTISAVIDRVNDNAHKREVPPKCILG